MREPLLGLIIGEGRFPREPGARVAVRVRDENAVVDVVLDHCAVSTVPGPDAAGGGDFSGAVSVVVGRVAFRVNDMPVALFVRDIQREGGRARDGN